MINCPTCGHPVPDHQRFCGNCGTDVKAAAPTPTPAPPAGVPIGEGQAAPYAYSQPSGYGYEAQPLETSRPAAGRLIVVLVVLLFAACCSLLCGILIGIEFGPMVFPSNPPAPRTPTRESLWLVWHYVSG